MEDYAMYRPIKLLVPGAALIAGLILAWTSAGRTQTPDSQTKDLLAEMRQREDALLKTLQMLRADLEDVKGQLHKQTAANIELADKMTELQKRADEADLIAKALQVRSENLLAKLKDKDRVQAKTAKRDGAVHEANDATLTPSKENVCGQVSGINSSDHTLIEVNIGKNASLEKHVTLEVFRPGDPAEYVGSLRVFEVYEQRATCRLVSHNPLKKLEIKVGDAVAAGPAVGR
jgi:hypothetical protein